MKLIVVGATGLVGTEVLRLALRNPRVTSVIALARRSVEPPANAGPLSNTSKFRSVVLSKCTDAYPPDVQQVIAGADACIWALAVTPSASAKMPFEEVKRICADYTTHALTSLAAAGSNPFRFIYVSGILVERDQQKELPLSGPLAPYFHMRGQIETDILAFAAAHAPRVQAAIVKPGGIDGPGREAMVNALMKRLADNYGHEPRIHVSELAAVTISLALDGIGEVDTLYSNEMAERGKKLLGRDDYLT